MKVLITGITGGLGRLVTHRLVEHGHEVIGIDRRDWHDAPAGVTILRADIRKRPAEEVFRTQRPDALIHMATVTHFTAGFEERFRINLGGTRRLFDHCHHYGVKQAVFVGRHTAYGAASDSPLYHTEDDPPLGGSTFPALADLVAADMYAASTLWRFPDLRTAVLRIVYPLGPSKRGTLASFLAGRRVPMVLGFDPLYHFMHEYDVARAIVMTLEQQLKGVFNVAGPPPVPLSVVCHATGRRPLRLPETVFPLLVGRFGLPKLPPGATNHVKYPIVLDDTLFKKTTGFKFEYDEEATLEGFGALE
ncbi:MAG: SDR family oxidoreductase [Planctomycetota bacterium]